MSAKSLFLETIVEFRLPQESIRERLQRVQQDVLAQSAYVREANFTAIHPQDLALLFRAYDEHFFAGRCRQALQGSHLGFRLSPRMTVAGGKTTRFRSSAGDVRYEIAIACSLLFDGLRDGDRSISVCGLPCATRLEALQRIFEHEMVHLAENICWDTSDCAAPQFQHIASRLFLHQAHTHQLVTRRERARGSGIRPGALVRFIFDGHQLTGRVNRITKRVTVLVEDPQGQPFSNGLRYKTYYVPIAQLDPFEPPAQSATAQSRG